jgi:ferritin-like metal-binding protein YciE
MQMDHLQDLFIEQLKDLYSAETQLIKALPRMAKAATNEDLKSAFNEHLEQTKVHVERLEQIFEQLDERPKGKKCKGMEGLIAEGKEALEEDAEPEVMDAGLICAAQKVEHYEIAGYGCVRTYAQLLGNDQAARVLQKTLEEEGQTDKKLTALAEAMINVEAAAGADA